eukprot:1155337-Pelagomonas_calceolata.AAC.5
MQGNSSLAPSVCLEIQPGWSRNEELMLFCNASVERCQLTQRGRLRDQENKIGSAPQMVLATHGRKWPALGSTPHLGRVHNWAHLGLTPPCTDASVATPPVVALLAAALAIPAVYMLPQRCCVQLGFAKAAFLLIHS